MKCKRIFKVVSALALTVALLVSTGVVSFAASYTTTTKYLSQDTIEVTSVASELQKGDMATYVAYNGDAGFSDTNAVYIDQATADDTGIVTFTYQADSDKVKATVKFGGSTETTATDPDKDWLKVNVVVNNGEATEAYVPYVDSNYEDEYLAREFSVTLDENQAVDTVSYVADNAAAETPVEAWYVKNGAIIVMSNVIKENGTLKITTKTAEEVELKIGAVTGAVGSITAFAQYLGSEEDYGILIGADATTVDETVAWNADNIDYATETVKLQALGQSENGGFCVELQDEAIVAGTYKVAAYAGSTTVTTVQDVVITASVDAGVVE